MVKRFILLAVATVFFAFHLFVNTASAREIPVEKRTVSLNAEGAQVEVTIKQYTNGETQFKNVCSQCHLEGITKTDFNQGLDLETLALAYPARTNIEALIEYLKNPKSFDGELDRSDYHPSKKSQDIFREMRNITEDDLYDLAGFMLIQPKVNPKWGGGKTIR